MNDTSRGTERAKRWIGSTRTRFEEWFEAAAKRNWVLGVGVRAVRRDNEIGGFVLAGAIAFRLFVYLLPLFLLVLIVASVAFSFDPDGADVVASGAGLSAHVITALDDATETSLRSLWILVPATAWALFVAGRSTYRVVALAHSNAWRQAPRPARATATVGVAVFALSTAGGMALIRYGRSEGFSVVATVAALAFFSGLWCVVSLRLPRDADTTWMDLVPGALMVGLGSQGLYLFNLLYLQRRVESASEAYGALGLAATALLWLYLLGRLIVAAPVINAVVREQRVERERAAPAAGLASAPTDGEL